MVILSAVDKGGEVAVAEEYTFKVQEPTTFSVLPVVPGARPLAADEQLKLILADPEGSILERYINDGVLSDESGSWLV